MAEFVKVDETALQAKVADLEAKIAALTKNQMPDDVKQKLKDVLTWVISTL